MDEVRPDAPDPRPTYNWAFWATLVGLNVALVAGISVLDRLLFPGNRQLGGVGGVFTVPLMVVSAVVATRVCRLAGVSRDGRWTDTIRRGDFAAPDGPAECELRVSPNLWRGFAWATTAAAAVMAGVVAFVAIKPGEEVYGWLLLAFLGGLGLYFWALSFTGAGFLGRVDAAGVEAIGRLGLGRTRVGWDSVGSCEIPTVRNAIGEVYRPRFVFRGVDGEALLTVKPFGAAGEDAARFRDAVAFYLGTATR